VVRGDALVLSQYRESFSVQRDGGGFSLKGKW